MLDGKYEYWIELNSSTLAGDLTIILRDGDGRVVREWENPANPALTRNGWHVFAVNGGKGSVISIDELTDDRVEDGDHVPSTNVCRS